jgi:hypothetical protein
MDTCQQEPISGEKNKSWNMYASVNHTRVLNTINIISIYNGQYTALLIAEGSSHKVRKKAHHLSMIIHFRIF